MFVYFSNMIIIKNKKIKTKSDGSSSRCSSRRVPLALLAAEAPPLALLAAVSAAANAPAVSSVKASIGGVAGCGCAGGVAAATRKQGAP